MNRHIAALVQLLRTGNHADKAQAAGMLADLVEAQPAMQQAVADAGAIPPLVALLGSKTERAQSAAAGALVNMIGSDAERTARQQAIADAGAIPALVAMLGSRSEQVQQEAM